MKKYAAAIGIKGSRSGIYQDDGLNVMRCANGPRRGGEPTSRRRVAARFLVRTAGWRVSAVGTSEGDAGINMIFRSSGRHKWPWPWPVALVGGVVMRVRAG